MDDHPAGFCFYGWNYDDLGVKVLLPQQYYEFSFKPTLIGRTDFYCSFQWIGSFKWFDVYVDGRDYCHECWWSIKSSGNGPCRLNFKTGQYDDCLPWNKN